MSITTTSDRLEVIHDPADDDGQHSFDVTTDRAEGTGPDVTEVQASGRPTFTITDAATSCSVSRKTITRKLAELAIHGAAKDDDGVWRIPVEALLAVGLHPGRSLPEAGHPAARPAVPAPVPVRPVEQDTITIPRDRWDDVRIRLARAEAEASERGLALADARLALRELTAGPAPREQAAALPTGPDLAGLTDSHEEAPAGGRAATGTGAGSPSQATTSGDVTVPEPGRAEPQGGQDNLPADVVAARNLAARTGGYVPAAAVPVKKRRWWQSR